jgi:alpha-beta hydrolase superfamily lysophospholipase
MIKKIVLIAVCIIIALHIGWYAISYSYRNAPIPDDATAQAAFDNYLKNERITVDRNSLTETFIEANGVRLHLDVFPIGKNVPTIVFIPGTSIYAKIYIELMYKLYLKGFNVVGFDPRGHGLSSGKRGDYTIDEIVDDTEAVVKYARKRFGGKIAVAGSSQGGIVAFYTAARDDSISAAVCHNLADLNGRDNLILSQLRPPVFMVPLAAWLADLYKNYSIPVLFYLDLKKERSRFSNAAELIRTNPVTTKWITIRAMGSLMRTPLAKPVEQIKVPIMLIHAGNDNIFPRAYVENIYSRLTCKKNYMLLENTDHLVMTNNVDDVVPKISTWLKGIM